MSLKCDVGLACNLCRECVETCPADALTINDDELVYDNTNCQYCEVCMDVCPEYTIRVYEVKE